MIRSPKRFIISLALPFLAGAIGSLATFPSIPMWYAGLVKPAFVPPNWIFGPVWTLLYVVMGVSLYLVWIQKSKQSKKLAFAFFGAQLVLNTAWSVVFFGLHQPVAAIVAIGALLLAILLTMVQFWRFSKKAAYLLVPYVLWVCFASALTVAIAVLNPGAGKVTSYEQVPLRWLEIKQWHTVIPINGSISDATYTYNSKDDQITLTTAKLESLRSRLKGCSSGLHALYFNHDGAKLVEYHPVETLCAPASTDISSQIQQIQSQLRAAAEQAEASK